MAASGQHPYWPARAQTFTTRGHLSPRMKQELPPASCCPPTCTLPHPRCSHSLTAGPSLSAGHDSQTLSTALSKQSRPANTGPSHPLHFAPGVLSPCEQEPEGFSCCLCPMGSTRSLRRGGCGPRPPAWRGKSLLETENLLLVAGVRAKSLQSCPTLCDPMDCSPPGFSVRGILQARILEWVAMSSSRGSSRPRDRTQVSCVSCTGRRVLSPQPHPGGPQYHKRSLNPGHPHPLACSGRQLPPDCCWTETHNQASRISFVTGLPGITSLKLRSKLQSMEEQSYKWGKIRWQVRDSLRREITAYA